MYFKQTDLVSITSFDTPQNSIRPLVVILLLFDLPLLETQVQFHAPNLWLYCGCGYQSATSRHYSMNSVFHSRMQLSQVWRIHEISSDSAAELQGSSPEDRGIILECMKANRSCLSLLKAILERQCLLFVVHMQIYLTNNTCALVIATSAFEIHVLSSPKPFSSFSAVALTVATIFKSRAPDGC